MKRKVISDLTKEALYILTKYYKKREEPESWKIGEKGEVILVPGFNDDHLFLTPIGNALNKKGFRVHIMKNFDTTKKSIEDLSRELANYIEQNDLQKIRLVAHSKGGIVSRYLLENYPEIGDRVEKVFTIATPHHGTIYASTKFLNLEQISPKSKIIKDLNASDKNLHKIYNLYPALDNSIVPNKNLILEGARVNQQFDIIGHTRILKDEHLTQYVVENC